MDKKPKKRPNILLLMTDQMRADALGCRGLTPTRTPNLDSLALEGTVYTNCATVSPICAPARAALLAGLYPHQMGIWNNDPHTFPAKACNWVKDLREAGYRTSVFGKTHYYPYNGSVPDMREAEPLIQSYGYQEVDEIPGPRVSGHLLSHMTAHWRDLGIWDAVRADLASRNSGNEAIARPSVLPLELYPDVYVGETAAKYLRSYDRSEPFFCFVSFGGPHDPWDCPREFARAYDEVQMPAPLPLFTDKYPSRPHGVWDKKPKHPPFSPADVQAIRRDYAGKVSLIDAQIGKLLDILREKNLMEDTIIVFTSDHGEMNGDYDRLYKYNFFQSSLMVPLIIRVPDCASTVSDELVEFIDIGPRILDLAGVPLSYPQCGGAEPNPFVFSEYEQETMVYDGRWKMVVNQQHQPYLLFDLRTDPHEQLNLAGGEEFRDKEQELLEEIRTFLVRTATISYTWEGENRA